MKKYDAINQKALNWYNTIARPLLEPIFAVRGQVYLDMMFRIENQTLDPRITLTFKDVMDKPQNLSFSAHTLIKAAGFEQKLPETAKEWVKDIAPIIPEVSGLTFFHINMAPFRRNDPRGARTHLHFTLDTYYFIESANDNELGSLLRKMF
jgi:hypothetical protein